ncbi:uridine kinase [Agrococcus sp. ARC_14]|uniref:uridine kinase n=1 Tax=Agrococcus sp. ARC_14 TaxID=2919927 RepID=UPI001F062370|nr:uridine kinase [Agrococcus sp. ARC_14]MCH1883649.1 uridine kinase [Agrococcus sp. ARC_14]
MADSALLMRAASWTPEQKELYTRLAELMVRRNPSGRRLVAVEGRDGAGKTQFADALQVAFARAGVEAFRASVDDFHRAQAFRYRQGRDSSKGYYEDAFDIELLDRVLLHPFRMGGSTGFMTRAFDLRRDASVEMEWQSAGPDAVLIVDGVFLQRPALAGKWHSVIYLEAEDRVRGERMRARDGAHPDVNHASHARYREAHDHYERTSSPRRTATFIVDNTDWRKPFQSFADSC